MLQYGDCPGFYSYGLSTIFLKWEYVSWPPWMSPVNRELLFVLDLNGTLLHRLTKGWERSRAILHPKSRAEDCVVNGNPIHFRPGHRRFLETLFSLGEVAVWTSAMPKNAVPMVLRTFCGLLDVEHLKGLDPKIRNEIQKHRAAVEQISCGPHMLRFLWTQDECQVINRISGGRPEFKKHLDKIWKLYPQYTEKSTIMIDDSADKLSHYTENLLRISEFIVIDDKVDFTKDDTLPRLGEYLNRMSTVETELDVREYMTNHPFGINADLDNLIKTIDSL